MKFFSCLLLAFLISTIHLVAKSSIHEQLRFKSYTTEDGLSFNHLRSICQDKYGRLWIGTFNGLNVFDGYNFRVFFPNKDKENWLNSKIDVFADKKGDIYVYNKTLPLLKYNFSTDSFEEIFCSDSVPLLCHTITEDENGNLWIGNNKSIFIYNTNTKEASIVKTFTERIFINTINYINKKLYLGTKEQGLIIYDPSNNSYKTFVHNKNDINSISGNHITVIYLDIFGNTWIGINNKGICLFKETSSSFTGVTVDIHNQFSNKVKSIWGDSRNGLWLATRAGLYKYDYLDESFVRYAHKDNPVSKLGHNSVNSLFEDKSGVFWQGTMTGGLSYTNLYSKRFIHYQAKKGDDFFLNDAAVNAITKDKNGNLLISTEQGGVNIFNIKTQKYTYLIHQTGNANSLINNNINKIAVDGNNNYWIATYSGLDFYNSYNKKFKHYSKKHGISNSKVHFVFIDSKQNIWASTPDTTYLKKAGDKNFIPVINKRLNYINETRDNSIIGSYKDIFLYNTEKEQFEIRNKIRKKLGEIYFIFQESDHKYWLARGRGITLFNSETSEETDYWNDKMNMFGKTFSIIEDNSKNLWISGETGLCKLIKDSIDTKSMFRNYSVSDGLQDKQFNLYAYYKDDEGMLYFGGINGFNVFNPNKVKDNVYKPNVIFTNVKVFNKEVNINEEIKGMKILDKSIITTDKLTFSHKHSVFTLEFAALHFASPENNSYAFMLEGFDENWNYVDASRRFATYSSLPAGKYTFKVKVSNSDGIWNETPAIMRIVVLAAWWQVWWFKLIMLIILGLIIFIVVKFFVYKEKAMQEKELNLMKLKFFTNVAHEFRTPLVLIMAPFEKLMNSIKLNPKEIAYASLIKRNIKVLNKLIDELLYFRKSQNKYAKLNVSQIDIVNFIIEIFTPYSLLAKEREIDFKFRSEIQSLKLWFDPDKMEKIINNIIMNAFKYTSAGGKIEVLISQNVFLDEKRNKLSVLRQKVINSQTINISVTDSGKGMTKEQVEKIFKRYYKIDERASGTGIGLELVNTLVNLHGGRIFVESKPGIGSTFRLQFKKGKKHFKKDHIDNDVTNVKDYITEIEADTESQLGKNMNIGLSEKTDTEENKDKQLVLIVDDNKDLLNFLAENLSEFYNVSKASDGSMGVEMAVDILPDLIISDVVMPGLNGVNLCKAVKNNLLTSHIPVILLSKKVLIDDEINALQTGADEYIGKPFNLQYLLLKIRNLLNNRQRIKNFIAENPHNNTSEILNGISDYDQKFLENCKNVIMENLSNTEFSVEDLCEKVGLSRSHLHRKVTALTNHAPLEWIFSFRLSEAKRLLLEGNHMISEVADVTGFSSSSSFSTVFKRKYGKSPKVMINSPDDD